MKEQASKELFLASVEEVLHSLIFRKWNRFFSEIPDPLMCVRQIVLLKINQCLALKLNGREEEWSDEEKVWSGKFVSFGRVELKVGRFGNVEVSQFPDDRLGRETNFNFPEIPQHEGEAVELNLTVYPCFRAKEKGEKKNFRAQKFRRAIEISRATFPSIFAWSEIQFSLTRLKC